VTRVEVGAQNLSTEPQIDTSRKKKPSVHIWQQSDTSHKEVSVQASLESHREKGKEASVEHPLCRECGADCACHHSGEHQRLLAVDAENQRLHTENKERAKRARQLLQEIQTKKDRENSPASKSIQDLIGELEGVNRSQPNFFKTSVRHNELLLQEDEDGLVEVPQSQSSDLHQHCSSSSTHRTFDPSGTPGQDCCHREHARNAMHSTPAYKVDFQAAVFSPDPLRALQDLVHSQAWKINELQSLIDALYKKQLMSQAEMLENESKIIWQHRSMAHAESECEALRGELESLEDQSFTHQVHLDAVCREKTHLKEQVDISWTNIQQLQHQLQMQEKMQQAEAQRMENHWHLEQIAAAQREASMMKTESRLRDKIQLLEIDCAQQTRSLHESLKRIEELERRGVVNDAQAIKHVAGMLTQGLIPGCATYDQRRAAQRRLLFCLHPDKCPSSRVATQLTQEMQNSVWWVK